MLKLGVALLAAGATGGVAAAPDLPTLAAAARSILGADQGVYIESSDGSVLLQQAATRPVHPASVSKVPTTLALLRRLGAEHRFVTTFASTGVIRDGILDGDLRVTNDGDPYFVDENALLVAQRLRELGVRQITGELRVDGDFLFDWQSEGAAQRLRAALSGAAPPAAWAALRSVLAAGIEPPALQFQAARMAPTSVVAGPNAMRPLVVHRSQPLLALAKSLNDYSNNIFKPLADAAGGVAEVESIARAAVPAEVRDEITLGDGAGTDPRNRLSPRAAVCLLRALEQELAQSGHALTDILPVSGVDAGTLHDRLNAPGEAGRVVGKTGTFGDYGASALIGAIATSDRGTVYFAILDHGIAVPEARRRQDRFVRALLGSLNSVPWPYQPDARPAVARAEAVAMTTAATPASP